MYGEGREYMGLCDWEARVLSGQVQVSLSIVDGWF